MLSTIDEILYKMAMDIDYPVPAPAIPRFNEQDEDEKKEYYSKENYNIPLNIPLNIPIEIPVSKPESVENPASSAPVPVPPEDDKREKLKKDDNILIDPLSEIYIPGTTNGSGPNPNATEYSPEWKAYHNTYDFLKNTQRPFAGGYVKKYPKLTNLTMDWLTKEHPEKHFEWTLYRRQELGYWTTLAADSWLEKNPHEVLMSRIYHKLPKLRNKDFLTKLWNRVMDAETNRASQTESGEMFPGDLKSSMRHLAGMIATVDPEFYKENIYGKPLSSKQHDNTFRGMMINKSFLINKLTKMADKLDKAGEFELATKIDNITKEMVFN
jgi:hypothetical protein